MIENIKKQSTGSKSSMVFVTLHNKKSYKLVAVPASFPIILKFLKLTIVKILSILFEAYSMLCD